ncbi:HAD family phosphatase [Humisphaera borealis]|uniref:HAD family phosphatase n=1 Tax=Humisphaera borealis TaxID=2807512 RepID=A0A7M2X3Y4_9BACT|nr:HAD family phosphatase [Humisphaera borealis]
MQAVIFDMDGLMIDSERVYWQAGREVANRYGKTVKDATLGRMMGRSPIDSMTVFATETDIAVDPLALLAERDARVYEILRAEATPMPGLFETLDRLSDVYTLAIATSAKRYFVDVIDARLNFVRYFKAVQTSEGVVNGKPAPEIYHKAMKQIGMQPEHCVVLEDSSNGARAGKSSGAYTIAVPSEHTRDQDFSFVDYIAKDLTDAAAKIMAIGSPLP